MSALSIVFSNYPYVALAAAIAAAFWILFNVFTELLFFSPILVFYLPQDAVAGFVLLTITAVLLGIVVSMNTYVFRHSKLVLVKKANNGSGSKASLFSGTTVGIISSTCASCSYLGFLLVSTFGSAGAVLSAFFSIYQIYLHLISIALLAWAFYAINKAISKSCSLNDSSGR